MNNTQDIMKIWLGGKELSVPLLVAWENRIIDPLILKLLPLFGGSEHDRSASLARIGEVEYNALLDICYISIRRTHPEITWDIFLEMPITLSELMQALHIIAQQTGIFQKTVEIGQPSLGEKKAQEIPI